MPFTQRLQERFTRLREAVGIPGVVLVAALLADVLLIGWRALDDLLNGNFWLLPKDLATLPGIVAFAACALWAQRRALVATAVGAGVLLASTALIAVLDGLLRPSLITGISPSETVAGVELVVFCVRYCRPSRAALVISGLVGATVMSVLGRDLVGDAVSTGTLFVSGVLGAILLAMTVIAGMYLRRGEPALEDSRLAALFGMQWPLVGVLALVFFAEVTTAVDAMSLGSVSVLLCSLAALVAAAFAPRYPARAALIVAGSIVLSGMFVFWLNLNDDYSLVEGIGPGQVAAGLTVSLFLVRGCEPRLAAGRIAMMSAAVAFGVLLGSDPNGLETDREQLAGQATMAAMALAIAVAVGLYFRARDSERTKTIQAAVREAQTGERMALARELHDVVAHQVTGIVVQAQAARLVADSKPEVAQQALGRIEEGGLEALAAMRRLVGSMRGEAPTGSEATESATTDFAADLRALADGWDGLPVELELELDREVPLEVSRTVLRLVQESLTNTSKHAEGASVARVLARTTDSELNVRISDDGRASALSPVGGSGGYGIVGMRERVDLLGGLFSAGPGTEGSGAADGWRVEAWIPLR